MILIISSPQTIPIAIYTFVCFDPSLSCEDEDMTDGLDEFEKKFDPPVRLNPFSPNMNGLLVVVVVVVSSS